MVLSLALIVVFGLAATGSAKDRYTIGVAQFVSHPALDAVEQGFYDQLKEEGLVKGENLELLRSNAEADMNLASSIAKKYVQENVDLIFSITTPMSQAAVAAAKGTDVVVVFGAVTDPVKAGLVESWDRPGVPVSGASDWMDVGAQAALITEILPEADTVGVIYNAGEANSVAQVDELKKAAPKVGIDKIVEANVSTTPEVMNAAKSLVGRVDAVWIPTDNVAVAALEAIVKVSEDNQLPLFGSDVNQVQRGPIAASGISMSENGAEAAKIAARILLKGEDPATIPVVRSEMSDLYVNPAAAERMGVTIPESVMNKATKVVNQ
jgi:putative ABC transport system substrate-binding protein